jgi:uncharacterized membrane protein
MEDLITPEPISTKGRMMIGLLFLGFIALWILGVYAYFTLPERIPTHFGFSGEPTSYGRREVFLLLPAAFSPAPIIFLIIIRYRFTLLNKYPYLINLPAFFTHITKIPSERRSLWVNRYFKALIVLGVFITYYLLLLEWGIYVGNLTGRLPYWFTPATLLMPLPLILSFLFYLRRLSEKMMAEAEIDEYKLN